MYIPTWVFWIIGSIVVVVIATIVGRKTGDYDFVSPILGAGVVIVGIAFALGYWMAH